MDMNQEEYYMGCQNEIPEECGWNNRIKIRKD
jgi:hypothetical protein